MQQQLLIHSDDNFQIRMYSPRSGYVFTNKHVLCLWAEIVGDRVARVAIAKGGIRSAGELSVMLNNNRSMVFVATDKNGRVLMLSWINCICEMAGRVHFMGFKRAYRNGVSDIAKKMLRTALNIQAGRTIDGKTKYMFNTLIGYTPTCNKLAIRFVKSLGCMRIVGELENGCYDYSTDTPRNALVTHCTREDFI